MKALIALLLALLLTACGAQPAPEAAVPEAPLPPEVEEEIVLPGETQPMICYEAETVAVGDTKLTEDGIHLVTYEAEVPVLKAFREDGTEILEAATPEEERALAAIQTFNERFATWKDEQEFQKLLQTAKEDLAWAEEAGLDWHGGYQLELDCTIYQTERLISISGRCYSYTGGAHPNTYLLGWTFDVEKGAFFGAEALAGQEELQTAVSEEIIRQAEEKAAEYDSAPEEFFWPEYETIIADWPSYAVTFDADGMWVRFSPYELAAYAAGAQEFHLPYDYLKPYLDEHGLEVLELN